MADFRRIHTEVLAQVCKDRARQQVVGEMYFSQDSDDLTLFKGPVDITLAASATATEVDLPIGATKVKFLAVYDVDGSAGINVRLSGSGNDPILVKPPATSSLVGYLLLSTDATSVHVDNPSSTASVSCTILMGCSES